MITGMQPPQTSFIYINVGIDATQVHIKSEIGIAGVHPSQVDFAC